MSIVNKKSNKLVTILKYAAGWAIFLFLIGSYFVVFGDRATPMPPHAKVLIDDDSKTYSAPSYYEDNGLQIPSGSRIVSAREAKKINYSPNGDCVRQGYFMQEDGSLFMSIFSSPKKRWDDEGNWNY